MKMFTYVIDGLKSKNAKLRMGLYSSTVYPVVKFMNALYVKQFHT